MTKIFIFLKYNTYILSIAAKVGHLKGGIAIASSKTLKIFISSWFPSSSIRLGVLAACMLCSMLFSLVLIEYYLLSSFVVSLPHPL